MGDFVKVGQPTYHRKRKYFTIPATGDTVHEINLDYLTYPLIPVKAHPIKHPSKTNDGGSDGG